VTAEEQTDEAQASSDQQSTIVRLLAALLVKGEPKPAAATRLLSLGLSVNDIANVLEIKPASVRVIKHRAKAKPSRPKDSVRDPATQNA